MTKEFKPGEFEFRVSFYGKDKANIHFKTEPKSENIRIKYATPGEPEKLLDFEEFNKIISKHTYLNGEDAKFYVVNEEENQKELAKLQIRWKDAPSYDDTVRDIRLFGDLTDIIKKIGG